MTDLIVTTKQFLATKPVAVLKFQALHMLYDPYYTDKYRKIYLNAYVCAMLTHRTNHDN